MLLESYLKKHNKTIEELSVSSDIPISILRNTHKIELEKWNIEYFEAISKLIGKNIILVKKELSKLMLNKNKFMNESNYILKGKYNIENRRYLGNKNKLLSPLSNIIEKNTQGNSFFDIFAGTGVVTNNFLNKYNKLIINDFLFSNNVIYQAFFGKNDFNPDKLYELEYSFQQIKKRKYDDCYFVKNFGGKFFSKNDAEVIGEIRTLINMNNSLNAHEKNILIASLLYSADKIANTVGHYDAYRKNVKIPNKFLFELINIKECPKKNIIIFRDDANNLVKKIKTDITFIDPPYNSRQYSRFYHVLETITKWEKPRLYGVAMKPPIENISNYSKMKAPVIFDNLITNLNTNYIIVTYNNTYLSKSNSSRNKITHDQIIKSLNKVGETKVFEIPFKFFNSGKTNLSDHKEFVFITKVK